MDETTSRTVLALPTGPTAHTGPGSRAASPPEPLWRELVGQVLRSERVETGRTLQQVADRAGVSPQYLSEVERGRKDPSSEMLESICGALGLRLADLLSVSGRTLQCTSPVGTRPGQHIGRTGSTGAVLLAA